MHNFKEQVPSELEIDYMQAPDSIYIITVESCNPENNLRFRPS